MSQSGRYKITETLGCTSIEPNCLAKTSFITSTRSFDEWEEALGAWNQAVVDTMEGDSCTIIDTRTGVTMGRYTRGL